jgi:hypothetical protein
MARHQRCVNGQAKAAAVCCGHCLSAPSVGKRCINPRSDGNHRKPISPMESSDRLAARPAVRWHPIDGRCSSQSVSSRSRLSVIGNALTPIGARMLRVRFASTLSLTSATGRIMTPTSTRFSDYSAIGYGERHGRERLQRLKIWSETHVGQLRSASAAWACATAGLRSSLGGPMSIRQAIISGSGASCRRRGFSSPERHHPSAHHVGQTRGVPEELALGRRRTAPARDAGGEGDR